MVGGWSTVQAPFNTNTSEGLGSLSSYGAYDGSDPGLVVFTSPSYSEWKDSGAPEVIAFTYKVNDGTTDSDTKSVSIYMKK